MNERMEGPRDPQAEVNGSAVPDPWRDAPRWSEPAASDAMGAMHGADSRAGGEDALAADTAAADGPATCPWCATPAPAAARTCSSCGAALAQRESIGDLVIPGLTAVDPALADLADRPLHLTGPSPSQGVASGAIAAAAMGGPMGIAILGGIAAVAAAEFGGATRAGAGGTPVEEVGQASAATLQAIEKLERGEALPAADSTTPRPELEAQAPGPEPARQEDTADGGD